MNLFRHPTIFFFLDRAQTKIVLILSTLKISCEARVQKLKSALDKFDYTLLLYEI